MQQDSLKCGPLVKLFHTSTNLSPSADNWMNLHQRSLHAKSFRKVKCSMIFSKWSPPVKLFMPQVSRKRPLSRRCLYCNRLAVHIQAQTPKQMGNSVGPDQLDGARPLTSRPWQWRGTQYFNMLFHHVYCPAQSWIKISIKRNGQISVSVPNVNRTRLIY